MIDILYKYASWENPHHRKLLTTPEIYFCSPQYFNDPFDCSLRARYDLLTDEEHKKMIGQHIKRLRPDFSNEDINQEAQRVFNERNFEKPDIIEEKNKDENDFFYKYNGVFCLSAVKDNHLMWAHYASGHKGFCIGYYFQKFEQFFDRFVGNRKDINVAIEKVRYAYDAPIIKPKPIETDDEIITLQFALKHIDWQYEKEYRYIMTGSVNTLENIDKFRKVIIEKDIIAEVILGSRMTNEHKIELMSHLKRDYHNTKIYQAIAKENSYKLEFKDVTNIP